MISYAHKIPGHPKTCLGCSNATFDDTQCRLCWLATYDPVYRKKWNIGILDEPNHLPVIPQFPCIYRSQEPTTPGGTSCCSSSASLPIYGCSNPRVTTSCVVTGGSTQLSSARAGGYRVCSECGFRTPEEGLELTINEMKDILNHPLSALPNNWENMRVTTLAYQELIQEVAKSTYAYPQNRFMGRGIVVAAGGEKYFKCALVAHHVLRELGCTLPVQFWYLGPAEMSPEMLDLCHQHGIEAVDALKVAESLPEKPRRLNGWELKVFAVLHSRFEEVLFLDADNIPVQDPTPLFDHPEYLEHGAVFWPDVPPGREIAEKRTLCAWIPDGVFEHFGIRSCDTPDFESGQVLINKGRCWKETCITWWINNHSEWFYRMVYGDKSTFHLAWRLVNRKFAMPGTMPGTFQLGLVQHDFNAQPLFQHCTNGKHQLAGGTDLEGLVRKEQALQGWRNWNRRWNGKLAGSQDRVAHTENYTPGLPNLLDPQKKTPTLLQKAWSYGLAYTRWVAAGRPTRSDEEVAEILETCTTRNDGKPCEHWVPGGNENLVGGSCSDCGCRINFGPASVNKARMKTEICPKGFWA